MNTGSTEQAKAGRGVLTAPRRKACFRHLAGKFEFDLSARCRQHVKLRRTEDSASCQVGSKTFAVLFFLASSLTCFGQSSIVITNLAEQQRLGREFVQELLSQRPENNSSAKGVVKIREPNGKHREIPVRFQNIITETNWLSLFETFPSSTASNSIKLVIARDAGNSNRYQLTYNFAGEPARQWTKLKSEVIIKFPFAGDFGTADLGLEFLHWPEQRMIKKEMSRSQFCKVIESINPNPATNAYSKVISWIDHDSGGIVHAEAYDAKGKLLKEFDPKVVKKIKGEWQLLEMEMRNRQTGSRTRIEFDLETK